MVRGARKQGLLWQQECAAVTFHLLTSQWDRQQRGQEVAELETSRSTHPHSSNNVPSPKGFTTLSNTATRLGPNVQTHEHVGHI